MRSLLSATGLSVNTIHRILTKDLGLIKKSARWVPKFLSADQKKERVERCDEFLRLVRRRSKSVLDSISFHTPETKQQSKQKIRNGQHGPTKAKVKARHQKQMFLVYFDSNGEIYTNYVPRGKFVKSQSSLSPCEGS